MTKQNTELDTSKHEYRLKTNTLRRSDPGSPRYDCFFSVNLNWLQINELWEWIGFRLANYRHWGGGWVKCCKCRGNFGGLKWCKIKRGRNILLWSPILCGYSLPYLKTDRLACNLFALSGFPLASKSSVFAQFLSLYINLLPFTPALPLYYNVSPLKLTPLI